MHHSKTDNTQLISIAILKRFFFSFTKQTHKQLPEDIDALFICSGAVIALCWQMIGVTTHVPQT